MPTFAANLTMLWPELDIYDRFAAAAQAGFRKIEILFVHGLDQTRLRALLAEYDLELVLFDPYPGDWEAGERGLLCLPGRETEFEDSIRDALETAAELGTHRLNAIAGVVPPGVGRAQAERTAVQNLKKVASRAEDAGVYVLVENINTVDMPGYLADTPERAAAIVQAVDHPSIRLQLDQYHVGMMGGDARQALRTYRDLVEHVQIADVPGRHEPGTGQQPIREFLAELDELGYDGAVGLEYRPAGSTEAALDW
ncbi:MAG: TIM barrel protein, partial [Chloroflexi bacterium]|nr:TIM barrel protein [Chloroflexota bacterium]